MLKVKHLMEAVEPDDGQRIWVEPIGLTRDLGLWCQVHRIHSHLGPPVELALWFEEHPDGYDFFRARYHEALAKGPHQELLRQLAYAAARENVTLLHHSDNPGQNTGTALFEFLSELSAYCEPE